MIRCRAIAFGYLASFGLVQSPSLADEPQRQASPANPAVRTPIRAPKRDVSRNGETNNDQPQPRGADALRRFVTTEGPPALNLPNADSIKPAPSTPIPDKPPPHEGNTFDLPLVVDPPDVIIIEVLEALPGMPISGERLVRPDGVVSLGFYDELHVRGLTLAQIKEKVVLHLRKFLPDTMLGLSMLGEDGKYVKVEPRDSARVFVDITSYNSKFYYVQGEVETPGKMPFTASETVLDALNHAGGLLATSDPKNVRLIRPARGNKPPHVFQVDLTAIEDGDITKNYQVFPGDRLIVGRKEAAAEPNRQDAVDTSFNALTTSLKQVAVLARELAAATPTLSAQEREQLVRDWLEIWLKSAQKPGSPALDEATLRELLIKVVRASSNPAQPAAK